MAKKRNKKKRRKQTSLTTTQSRKMNKGGKTIPVNRTKLDRARTVVKYLDWASYASLILLVISHEVLELILWLPVTIVLVSAIVFVYFQEVIYVYSDDDDEEYNRNKEKKGVNAITGFIVPTLGIFFAMMFTPFNTLQSFVLWWVTPCAALVAALLLSLLNNKFKWKDEGTYLEGFTLLFCFMFYIPTSTVMLNYFYDPNPEITHFVEIYDKEIEKDGKYTDYLLELAPWEMNDRISEEEVKQEVYDRVKIGEKLPIITGEGLFGLPWQVIE